MTTSDRIRAAHAAGVTQVIGRTDPARFATDSDDRVAGRVTLWQGRLREAMVMAARQGTDRAMGHVQAVAAEAEMARRAAVARFSR